MLAKAPLIAVLALCGLASAYPSFLTDPNLNTVQEWNEAAAKIRADIEASRTTYGGSKGSVLDFQSEHGKEDLLQARGQLTRGSQPNPTDPCYNVYQYPSPTNNPEGQGPDGSYGHGYQAPRNNDVRAPCPALNTLANHGYLNRDGRNINGSSIINAFVTAWGIDESVISIAKDNALAVCTFQSGGSEDDNRSEVCESFDLNVLNTPHMFEHDHSLSRNDYQENWSNAPANNHVFNGTVFNESLAVIGDSCFMSIHQANEVRLQREVDQYLDDKTGWFTLAPSTQLTEIGFLFAVMTGANQPGGDRDANHAVVQVNWWQYWFMYESFPTDLGWQVPSPPVQGSFVASISSLVEHARITSTPSPFYTEFVAGPTGTFPSSSTPGQPYFNPTLGNVYSTALQNDMANNKRDYVEATPTPVVAVLR